MIIRARCREALCLNSLKLAAPLLTNACSLAWAGMVPVPVFLRLCPTLWNTRWQQTPLPARVPCVHHLAMKSFHEVYSFALVFPSCI